MPYGCSVAHSCLTLQPHGLQHTRPPCPSPSPGSYSDSCPLHRWCHPTISSSVIPFSSCLQLFTESRSFPMNWLFTSGGQSIRASSSAIVFPTNTQGLFPLGLAGLISLLSKGLSRESVAQQQVTNTSAFSWGIVVGSLQGGPRRFLHSFVHTLCSSVLHYTRIALQDHNIQQTC